MARAKVRERLTRAAVLHAALTIADKEGLESLSMRRLAQEVGVEAMSLYHHVRDKNDLLEGMVDLVFDEIEMPAARTQWKTALRRTALSARDALARHAWATAFIQSRAVGPARLRYMEGLLRTLRDAGLSAENTDHAYHAIDSHIVGYTLWAASFRFDKRDVVALAKDFVGGLSAAEYPRLLEHVDQHTRPRRPGVDFEFGLDLIVDGLEKYRAKR